MRDILQKYANTFSTQLEKISLSENEQRSVNHPVVFLFLGDLVHDALKAIMTINEEKWQNSSGVLYFHACQTDTVTAENVLSIQLPSHGFDRKTIRKDLYEAFNRDEDKLIELNKTYRKLAAKIAQYGKVYSSLIKVNLCVVAAIDDPANGLIQEFTLLLKSILQESFRLVEVDLYGFIKEKQEENVALSTSLGISFFKELDRYQSDEYTFSSDLQLTEDQLRLTVSHPPSPLFDLVYLLSDKNEDGLISSEAIQQNYEIISNLNLLKNRKMMTDYHEKMDSYNHAAFRKGIKGSSMHPVYASAGISKVKRPNKAIAIHAAHHLFQELLGSLKANANQPRETVLSLVELSEASFQRYFHEYLPSAEKLWDMNGLMGITHSYQCVKRMSVREAEEYLYEGGSEAFFAVNFEEPVTEQLKQLNLRPRIRRDLYEHVINNEKYGLFCAYLWTADSLSGSHVSVIGEIHNMLRNTKSLRLEAESKLEQHYGQMVDSWDFKKSYLPFSDKKNLTSFTRSFFEIIYGTKYEILKLEVKEAILKQYLTVLEETHRYLRGQLECIDQVESCLKQAAAESLYDSDDYLDKNIAEYYADIISGITSKLKETHGPNFFLGGRFFGNVLTLLEKGGPQALLERVISVCNREVLTQGEFHRSFEDELLERANIMTRYENRDILSKEDLFKQLYLRLHENSSVHIEVFNYTQEHRYEEKYFFGDFYSKFMKFALDKEYETRQWKVGCAHEKKSGSIEKLTLMGGFQLKDLMYYRNGEKYYKAYCENGYEFHPEPSKSTLEIDRV